MDSETAASTVCPDCSAACPDNPGFVTWCDACGWNLKPSTAAPTTGTVRRRIGRWMGASVVGEFSGGRKRAAYRVAIFAYATLVYALVIGLAVGGVAVAALGYPNPFAVILGIVMLAVAFLARPQVESVPDGLRTRAELPALYELADRVSDSIGADRVDGILLTTDFNAFLGRFGWRRRLVLGVGLPLFTILDGQQRVALIGHEMAHDVNGDPARGAYVGDAYRAMLELHGLLDPIATRATHVATRGTATASLGAMVANVALFVLSLITRPFVLAFEVLMRRESQRAEYLADSIAAEVAGRDAARSLLRTLHITPSLLANVRTLAVRGENEDVFGVLRRRVADTPAREWQRLDRVMALEETQLDSTHPPTAQRIRVIDGRPLAAPLVVLDAEQRDALDRDLLSFEPAYARRLFELARDSLYQH